MQAGLIRKAPRTGSARWGQSEVRIQEKDTVDIHARLAREQPRNRNRNHLIVIPVPVFSGVLIRGSHSEQIVTSPLLIPIDKNLNSRGIVFHRIKNIIKPTTSS